MRFTAVLVPMIRSKSSISNSERHPSYPRNNKETRDIDYYPMSARQDTRPLSARQDTGPLRLGGQCLHVHVRHPLWKTNACIWDSITTTNFAADFEGGDLSLHILVFPYFRSQLFQFKNKHNAIPLVYQQW